MHSGLSYSGDLFDELKDLFGYQVFLKDRSLDMHDNQTIHGRDFYVGPLFDDLIFDLRRQQ